VVAKGGPEWVAAQVVGAVLLRWIGNSVGSQTQETSEPSHCKVKTYREISQIRGRSKYSEGTPSSAEWERRKNFFCA